MKKKEAIWILENGAWWDSLPDDMSDADKNPLLAAIDVALDALKMPEKREPLTQAHSVQVCPLCKGKGTLPTGFYGNPGCSQGDVMQNKFPVTCQVCFGKGVIEIGKEEKNEQPAHIDREAWKPCELCISCENCKNSNVGEFCNPCFRSLQSDKKDGFSPVGFCRECGRPLTEEAWAELEKRLRG